MKVVIIAWPGRGEYMRSFRDVHVPWEDTTLKRGRKIGVMLSITTQRTLGVSGSSWCST